MFDHELLNQRFLYSCFVHFTVILTCSCNTGGKLAGSAKYKREQITQTAYRGGLRHI